jgi:hypothetical protein
MKILQNEITGTQTSFSTNFGGNLSFILSFPFPERLTSATYIFTAPTCTTTIISCLEPSALSVEFQHFMPGFNKNFIILRIPLKGGIGDESRGDWG